MELLSQEFEYPELADNYYHGQSKSVFVTAREEAKKWLKENKEDHINEKKVSEEK